MAPSPIHTRSSPAPVDACRDRLSELLYSGGELADRLAEANTTVLLEPADGGSPMTLLLDRRPVEIVDDGVSAEVELNLSPDHFDALAAGRLNLQHEILHGRISYSGPVRKFLSVTAVLMNLLEGASSSHDIPAPSANGAPTQSFSEREAGEFWAMECCGVHKRLGGNEVLSGLDLGIPEGLITVIMGPSGTGKSVLLKHLFGLLKPDAGDIRVRGRSLLQMSGEEILRLRTRMGILFQDGALWGSMNLFDNVALPLRQHTDLPEHEVEELVGKQLARVGLADAVSLMSNQLSGGMRKRGGFARALVLDPEIIFFDEPDSGLDPVRTALLADLIAQMHSQLGGTYVVITHNVGVARQIADYVAVLWQGQVIQSGTTGDIFSRPDPFVEQFLAGHPNGPLGMD